MSTPNVAFFRNRERLPQHGSAVEKYHMGGLRVGHVKLA
jgi:hypothetical protein